MNLETTDIIEVMITSFDKHPNSEKIIIKSKSKSTPPNFRKR